MSHSNYFLYNWSWLKADKWCWCFCMTQSILLNVTHGVKLLHRSDSESDWRCCFFYSICVESYFLLLPPNFSTGISKASSLSHTVFVGCFNLRHLSFPWACTFFYVARRLKPRRVNLFKLCGFTSPARVLIFLSDWKVPLLSGNLFRFRWRSRQTGGDIQQVEVRWNGKQRACRDSPRLSDIPQL